MLFDDGNINEIDMQIYLRWFDEFMKDIPIKGIIYVKTLPIKCFERVKKRGRKGEIIPIEYLERCLYICKFVLSTGIANNDCYFRMRRTML